MKLKKDIKKMFWTPEGISVFEEIGFFVWAKGGKEEVLPRTAYQLIRELGEGIEEQISVSPGQIVVDIDQVKYNEGYVRGQWNDYGTYSSTPEGDTICILVRK